MYTIISLYFWYHCIVIKCFYQVSKVTINMSKARIHIIIIIITTNYLWPHAYTFVTIYSCLIHYIITHTWQTNKNIISGRWLCFLSNPSNRTPRCTRLGTWADRTRAPNWRFRTSKNDCRQPDTIVDHLNRPIIKPS